MSQKSKTIFAIIVGSVMLIFVLALVAAGGYVIGRNYLEDNQTGQTETVSVVRDDEVSSESETEPSRSAEEIAAAAEDVSGDNDSGETPEQDSPTAEPTDTEESAEESQPRIPPDVDEDDLELLKEIWDVVGDNFDGQFPSDEEVIYGAIAGSLELLDDQHTRFVPEGVVDQLQVQIEGSYEGIGAFVDMTEEGLLEIVRPMEGRPADLAGIKSGDLITHVDGESVLGKTIDEITAAVKGPRGTEVTLTLIRESETFDVTVVRKLIKIPIVESELLEEGIAYIRLSSFSAVADEQVTSELEQLLEQEPAGLIFDLRDNPGGLLSQAVSVSDIFLSEGIILYERDSEGDEKIFSAENGQLGETIPLVILVNEGSASASEIVAGAVQEHERGILIGAQTFGKGSVQQSHKLSDGSELRVTIARWYTPFNISIDKEGITPDIEVETPEEFLNENDTQLQRAIEYILNGE